MGRMTVSEAVDAQPQNGLLSRPAVKGHVNGPVGPVGDPFLGNIREPAGRRWLIYMPFQ